MKKFIMAIVIVLIGVAGWVGASYVIGGQIERHYSDHLARFAQWGPLHMSSESYHRGVLSARGRTLLGIRVPVPADEQGEVETETLRLTLEHRLYHGPLPVGNGFALAPQLARIETRLVAANFGDENEENLLADMPWLSEISLLTSIGFDGGGRGQLRIPAMEKTVEQEQLTFSWGGLRSDTRFSENLATLAGDLELATLNLTAEDGYLQWDGARAEFDLHEAFPLVYLGSYRANSDSLKLVFDQPNKGRRQLRIEGFGVDSLASSEGDTVEYLQTLKVAKVAVDEIGYGPGALEVAVRGLDGKVLSRYQQEVLEVYGQEPIDPEAIGARMGQVYLRLLTGLAEGSPEIELRKLQLVTPDGDFSGNLRLKLHGEAGSIPSDLPTLLQRLEGGAQMAADESLVRKLMTGLTAQKIKTARRNLDMPPVSDEEIDARAARLVQQQLETLVSQKFIERGEGKLRSQAEFENGALTVNGRRLL